MLELLNQLDGFEATNKIKACVPASRYMSQGVLPEGLDDVLLIGAVHADNPNGAITGAAPLLLAADTPELICQLQ